MATAAGQNFVQRLEKWLHEKNSLTDILAAAETKTGIKRTYLSLDFTPVLKFQMHVSVSCVEPSPIAYKNSFLPFGTRCRTRPKFIPGFLALLAIYMVIGFGAELICNSIGFLYPAYCSMHALETSNKDDDTKWLTYWVVFASFSVVEFFSDIFLDWFPFYWLAKCVFLIWCFAPIGSNGSQVLYGRVIRPFFLKNKEKIDSVLNKGLEKVASFASTTVGEATKIATAEAFKKE